jgi:hypothetical protein
MRLSQSVRGPHWASVAGIDDQIPVVLEKQVCAVVSICLRGPDGFAIRGVQHQVPILLHHGPRDLTAVRAGSPDGFATLGQNKVSIRLEHERELTVGGHEAFIDLQFLARVETI